MIYTLDDFKTGQIINTAAKRALWSMILTRTFPNVECAISSYEKHYKNGTWDSFKLNGMTNYIDELTGGKYGKDDSKLHIVASTLAVQFKKKFASICHLVSDTKPTLEEHFSKVEIVKREKHQPSKPKQNINLSQSFSILSYIHSHNLSKEELIFIANNLLST